MIRSIMSWRIAFFLPLILTIIWIKPLGQFERIDLLIFDLLYQLRPPERPDDRVVIVGITEKDIQSAKTYPFSDEYLAKIISKIRQQSPAVIGLDLVRDVSIAPGQEKLNALFRSKNLVAAGTVGVGNEAIAFPPAASIQGDVTGIEDRDGSTRRFFLYPSSENPVENFSLAIALVYLQNHGIHPTASPEGWLKLNNTVFPGLKAQAGGYASSSDMGGYQMLIHWRKNKAPFQIIPVSAILDEKIAPTLFKNKIVILGPAAPSLNDNFRTPFKTPPANLYGVEIHAHVLSQILSAVLDERPLLQAAPLNIQVGILIAVAFFSSCVLVLPKKPTSLSHLWFRQGQIVFLCLITITLITVYSLIFAYYWLPLASNLFFVLIYGIFGTLLKIHNYHIETLQSEINRVSHELNTANQILLEKSLEETAQQISEALIREISPALRDLYFQVEIAHEDYDHSIPPEQLTELEDNIDRIRNLIDYVMPSLQRQEEQQFHCPNYKKWLESTVRLAIGHRTQQSILINKVSITVHCSSSLAEKAFFLPKCLQFIVFALLDNAFDACLKSFVDDSHDSDLNVRILSELIDNNLFITVEDSGRKISDEIAQKMFLPFSTGKGSFGLGLYLSQKFAQQRNGTIVYRALENSKVFMVKMPIKI